MNADHTLVAVFDSAHARFFEYKAAHGRLETVLEDVASGLHHDRREIDTDRGGRGGDARGGQGHVYESHSDVRKLEKHDFVRAIADAVEAALDRHKFNALVVVAPPRSIGEFRSVASGKVKDTVWREVPKELANLTTAELERQLVPVLRAPEG
ncbi:MAG: host attachment protein [Alphaproteobacteria bacterium]|nr:host attachment protein [Alphaproteobacteria bacterium]